ncbi:MAG: hypothetical protein ACON4P_00850, partial [Candidatus Puniceispirillales bacterium]
VEGYPKSQMPQSKLLAAIETDAKNDDDVDKFYYHMKRIQEVGYLDSPHVGTDHMDGFDFIFSMSGRKLFDAEYELTWDGVNFIEALKNDTTMEKAKAWFKDMTVEQIKAMFPVLLTKAITGI